VCPKGALQPYCIDAPVNGAFVAIGLLYGAGDFRKTIEISTRCGQDSDCNPASAAGVLGVVLGFDALPEEWRQAANALGDEKFSYTDYSFREICESTLRRAKKLIAANGGRVTDDAVVVQTQKPRPVGELEQWEHGHAVKRVATDDPAWTFEGDWKKWERGMESNRAGDAAQFVFEGTGVEILSNWSADTGIVEIQLDGKRQHRFNTYEDREPVKAVPRVSLQSGDWNRANTECGFSSRAKKARMPPKHIYALSRRSFFAD
ncbi:MAG: ADP-ribosylglycohydrolase family protein, partial [Planctomycetes bacterium]|nr:ADP-ribosylglycohydrolase family protein [Planctomycetota bacterium]